MAAPAPLLKKFLRPLQVPCRLVDDWFGFVGGRCCWTWNAPAKEHTPIMINANEWEVLEKVMAVTGGRRMEGGRK